VHALFFLTLEFFLAIVVAPCIVPCQDESANCMVGICPVALGACEYDDLDCSIPPNACQVWSGLCNISSCLFVPGPDEAYCEDPCTVNGACSSGQCIGAVPVSCNAPCQTGGMCNITSGICEYTGTVQCPSIPCKTGSCDPTTGNCSYSPLMDGTPCDDGDYCTTGDNCTAGMCVGTYGCCPQRDPPKKSLCGICVKNCGNGNGNGEGTGHDDALTVLAFFGLTGTVADVSAAVGGGGRCPGPDVCCTPKNQTIFTYVGERCVSLHSPWITHPNQN